MASDIQIRLGASNKQEVDISDENGREVTFVNDGENRLSFCIEARIERRLSEYHVTVSQQLGVVTQVNPGQSVTLQIRWDHPSASSLFMGLPIRVKMGPRSIPMQVDLVGKREVKLKHTKTRKMKASHDHLHLEATEKFEPATCQSVKRSLSSGLEPTQSPRRETYVVWKDCTGNGSRSLFPVDQTHVMHSEMRWQSSEEDLNSTMAPSGQNMQNMLQGLPLSTIAKRKNPRVEHGDLEEDTIKDADGTIIDYLKSSVGNEENFGNLPPVNFDVSSKNRTRILKTNNEDNLASRSRPGIRNRGLADRKASSLGRNSVREGVEIVEWEEEQCEGLIIWLNAVLKKANWSEIDQEAQWKQIGCSVLTMLGKDKSNQTVNLSPNVTKEKRSLKHFSQTQYLHGLRKKARDFYHHNISQFEEPLDKAIACGKIAMDPTKKVYVDTGVRKSMMTLLMGVNPLWLRISLEAVFCETIDVGNPPTLAPLAHFVATRLFIDPLICEKYRSADVRRVMISKQGDVEQGEAFMKRIILLLMFVDKAKNAKLIPGDPCLFRVDSSVQAKSLKSILDQLSSQVLSASCGNLRRTLSRIGYQPVYEQNFMHEFNYRVTNLASDLKDGIRLVKVVELMSGQENLSSQLLFPPTSLTQMQHNVKLALNALQNAGCHVYGIEPGNINIPHREKIFDLMWRIIFHFEIVRAVDIHFLIKVVAKLRHGRPPNRKYFNNAMARYKFASFMHENVIYLIFEWCRLIAQKHGVQMSNFDESMTDGRVLQSLLFEHCPQILPEYLYWDSRDFPHNTQQSGELINHELARMRTVFNCVRELGVPLLVRPPDANIRMRRDPQMMILFVSLLCGKLIQHSRQNEIALLILNKYRLKKRIRLQMHLLGRMNASAVLIQRKWRGSGKWNIYFKRWILVSKYERNIIQHVVHVQSVFRGILARRRFMNLKLTKAVILIQSHARGLLLRKEHRANLTAVTRVQSWFRGSIVRRRVSAERTAALCIQSWFRRCKLTRDTQTRYTKLRESVIIIQAYVRGLRVRIENTRRIHLIAAFQAQAKGFLVRRQMQRQLSAAKSIQIYYRNILIARKERRHFLVRKQNIIVLQSHVRAFLARREYKCTLKIVIRMQALCRGWIVRRRVLAERSAALFIQSWYRRCTMVRNTKAQYMKLRATALQLQAYARGLRVRRDYTRCVEIITALQAHSKAVLFRRQMKKELSAVKTIQTHYRNIVIAKRERQDFLGHKQKIIVLQSYVRCFLVRREYKCMISNITRVQAHSRGSIVRRRLCAQRTAALCIQSWFRNCIMARNTKAQYMKMRQTIIQLQCIGRVYLLRQKMNRELNSIVRIQSYLRRIMAVKVAQTLRERNHAATLIQKWVIGQMRVVRERQHLLRVKQAVTLIQAHVRGQLARREYARRMHVITVLQAQAKAIVVRKQMHRELTAVKCFQAHYRRILIARKERKELLVLKDLIISFQSRGRGFLLRKEFMYTVAGVVNLQAKCRGWLMRRRIFAERSAALCIQSWYRRCRLTRETQAQYTKVRHSVIKIQAYLRGRIARMEYARRMHVIIALKAQAKGVVVRKQMHRELSAVKFMQIQYRNILRARKERTYFLHQKNSIITLQSYVRGWLVRKEYKCMISNITRVQAHSRGSIVRRRLCAQRTAALCIQSWYRKCIMARNTKAQYTKMRQTIIQLQSLARTHLVRVKIEVELKAILIIQSQWRRFMAVKTVEIHRQKNHAATIIQSWVRGQMVVKRERQRFLAVKQAAISIQAHYRGFCVRREYRNTVEMVIKLQSLARGHIVRSEMREFAKQGAILQAIVRGNKVRKELRVKTAAASVIQRFLRNKVIGGRQNELCRQLRVHFVKQQHSAVIIKSVLRTFVMRKKMIANNTHIKRPAMLPRLPELEHSIRGRLLKAIRYVRKQRKSRDYQLSSLARYLMAVESACRVTPESCAFLIAHDDFIECLYAIMADSNLSPHWIAVVHPSVQILRNLAISKVRGAIPRIMRSGEWYSYLSNHLQSIAIHTELFIDACVFLSALYEQTRASNELTGPKFVYALNQTRKFVLKSRTSKDTNRAIKVAESKGNSSASKAQRITQRMRQIRLQLVEAKIDRGEAIEFRPGWCLNRKLPTASDLDSQQDAFNYVVKLYKVQKISPII